MNIVVIGLGSMGRRRIRLIKKYNESFEIHGIDLNTERCEISKKEFGIETSSDLDKLLQSKKYDCAFVCTSPLSHATIISKCLASNLHVFTELNLVSNGYDANIKLARERERVLFLSSTFLYREEILKIKEIIKNKKQLVNYSYHVGQYLPDWHPWENFKDFFVGDKRTNGCREIFAIELPWIIDIFGEISNTKVVKDKISSLNIDYNDNYLVIFEHSSGHKGVLTVDIICRKAVRNLEIYGENLYLTWDGSAEGLKVLNLETKEEESIKLYDDIDQLKQYSKFVVENAYFSEIVSFFDVVAGLKEPVYNFEKDKYILKIIDNIEA